MRPVPCWTSYEEEIGKVWRGHAEVDVWLLEVLLNCEVGLSGLTYFFPFLLHGAAGFSSYFAFGLELAHRGNRWGVCLGDETYKCGAKAISKPVAQTIRSNSWCSPSIIWIPVSVKWSISVVTTRASLREH